MQDPERIKFVKNHFKKIIAVDIDNTIAHCPGDYDPNKDYGAYTTPDYTLCTPIPERIAKINKLFDEGNYILYWTARGTVTGINHWELTNKQLLDWGCKFHKLIVQKPCFDLFIDDRNINSEEFFKDC